MSQPQWHIPIHAPKLRGFGLLDTTIVIIIIGIVVASLLYFFPFQREKAYEAAIKSNLTVMRKAIQLYSVQHYHPPTGDSANVIRQLTTRTDVIGQAGDDYGPYLQNGIPINPINGLYSILVEHPLPPADDKTGWLYDPVTTEFRANNSGLAPSGIAWRDL